MSPEQYRRVADLFDRACEQPPDGRLAFVAAEAADDALVREQVLAMLGRDGATSTGLETAGGPGRLSEIADAFTAPLPDRIDRYRVIRLLGEGGMGRVFECEQDSPRRRVAVKLLRPGMVRPAMLRRFRQEAEVLGRLSHPGIARIYDAGTWDAGDGPQPYFALEYVEGLPLDRYADAHALDVTARLELLLEVCAAVQDAHENGVIHRDLKPDNVLVDDDGRPRVLDFGIARTTDADLQVTSIHTATGQLLGTLQYMSPEQCGATPEQLDVRSDVYALGVILYELLCGRRPYDVTGMSLPEAVRVIQEQSPSRPSTIDRLLRGDLETIVLKALEKEPSRRYDSVRALADDLRRHLADEPILARPPSTFYQLRKLARRHRTATASLAVLAVGLVTATVLSVGFALSEATARRAAERAGAVSRERAEELEVVNGFLEEMLEQADPWKSGGDVSIRTAVERARDLAAESYADRPVLEARIRETLGRTLVGLGRIEDGVAELERAVALAEAARGPDDIHTLQARLELGGGLRAQGRDEDAVALLQEVLDDALARPRDPASADGPIDEDALVIEVRHALGQALHNLGRWEEADRMAGLALAAAERRHGPDARQTLEVAPLLAWNDLFRGEVDAAIDRFERLDGWLTASDGEDSHRRVPVLNGLGQAALDQFRYDDAEQLYRRALELSRRAFGDGHPDVMVALSGLSNLMVMSARPEQAIPYQAEAVEIVRSRLGPDHRNTHVVMGNLGGMYGRLGRFEEADRVLRDVLDARRRTLPGDHPDIAKSFEQLGVLMYRQGRYDEAADLLLEARAIYQIAFDGPTAESIACLSNLAASLRGAGRYPEGITVAREVLAFDQADLGPNHPIVCDDLISLARMLFETGAYQETRERVAAATAIAAGLPDSPRRTGRCALLRARLALVDGDPATAAAEMAAAWTDLEAAGSLDEAMPHVGQLATALRGTGDDAGAAEWEQRVAEAEAAERDQATVAAPAEDGAADGGAAAAAAAEAAAADEDEAEAEPGDASEAATLDMPGSG